ncbi:YceI family protein [Frondihabitans peucedani]|jgi:polyisoprenoid-binding protein YceI|uniref:YceI family protein n=1 Tax=Frondihabitans peucedani TaxID=598626 RepID=A0ABP8DYX3_9MICO
MKKKTGILLGAGIAVVVLGTTAAIAGPIFYRDVVVGKPAAAPTVAVTPGSSSLTAADLTGSWDVASGSTAGYRVKEVLNGTDVTVVGTTSKVDGTVTFDSGSISAADVTVSVKDIATDSSSRDEYFRTSAMETDIYPDATFRLTSPVSDTGLTSGKVSSFTATGTLTLHGVTREVEVPMKAALAGTGAEVSGSVPITFSDYKVTAPSLGFVTVQKTGSVEFLVKARPAS